MFNLNQLTPQENNNISPYLGYGSHQELKINKIELKVSRNTGSPKAILHMESRPVKDPNFKPIEPGIKGKVGKIGIGVYMKTPEQKQEFLVKLKTIASALGLEEEISKVSGNSFENVVEDCEKVIACNKFARYTIFAEEYPKQEGKLGIKLFLPRYNFVESLDIPVQETKVVEFDKSNPQHYKTISQNDRKETLSDMVDDMPF